MWITVHSKNGPKSDETFLFEGNLTQFENVFFSNPGDKNDIQKWAEREGYQVEFKESLMQLSQEVYEDDNGRPVKADNISVIGTFKYKSDGFFSWTCGKCNEDHSSRAYKINGVIFECEKCHAQCLLLRSDCEDVNKLNANTGEEIRRLAQEEKK